jgi:hypothetical protein
MPVRDTSPWWWQNPQPLLALGIVMEPPSRAKADGSKPRRHRGTELKSGEFRAL